MAIDPSIPLQIQAPSNPLAQYAQAMQLQNVMSQGKLANLALQKEQNSMTRQNKLSELLSGGSEGLQERLLQGGYIDESLKLGKDMRENKKLDFDTEKTRIATERDKVGFVGQLLNGVRDQATYDQARIAAQQRGLDVSSMPPQYDPAAVEQKRQQALSVEEQLAQVWKQKGYDLDAQKFGETVRSNRATEGVSAGNLGVARANLGLRERELANGKTPPGYRTKADGTMEAIPGGPADLKAGKEGNARMTDAKDVISILDQAAPLIDASTNSYLGAGVDQVGRAFGTATQGAQAAAQLRALEGALISKMPKMSGPQSDKDVLLYKQMAGQIGDPTIPASQKKAAMSTIREINQRAASGPGGASGGWSATPSAPSLPSGWSVKKAP